MTVPTSWSSCAFSTSSTIANFDIENSFWNHRCDHIFRSQFTLLDTVASRISAESCCYNVAILSPEMRFHYGNTRLSGTALPAWHDPHGFGSESGRGRFVGLESNRSPNSIWKWLAVSDSPSLAPYRLSTLPCSPP